MEWSVKVKVKPESVLVDMIKGGMPNTWSLAFVIDRTETHILLY